MPSGVTALRAAFAGEIRQNQFILHVNLGPAAEWIAN